MFSIGESTHPFNHKVVKQTVMSPENIAKTKMESKEFVSTVVKKRRRQGPLIIHSNSEYDELAQCSNKVVLLSKDLNELAKGLDPKLLANLDSSRFGSSIDSPIKPDNIYVVSLDLK